MPTTSAGILVYRWSRDALVGTGGLRSIPSPDGGVAAPVLEVLLVHPGGPFWARKDVHAWSIPKGEVGDGEELFAAAQREFQEETGQKAEGSFMELPVCRTPGGRIIHIWAVEGEIDPARIISNTFEMEWPPKSGKRGTFPEVDRAAWFDLPTAKTKIHQGQIPILEALANRAR